MTAFKTLLAKKPIDPENSCFEETLLGHSERVLSLSRILTERFREGIKSLLQIDESMFCSWETAVWLSAWMHDWGKANDHFQQMIRDTSFKQGVRHETISLIIAEDLEGWLQPLWDDLPAWAKCSVLFAISGHHLKFPDPFEDLRQGTKVTVLFSHSDFKGLLQIGQEAFQLSGPPEWEDREYSLLRGGEIKRALARLRKDLDQDFNDVEKVMIAAVKATLMAADLAGSALPKKIDLPEEWLIDKLSRSLTTEQLDKVVAQKLNDQAPRQFQTQIKEAKCRTVLAEAGCGSGKTAGAYLWASRNANGKRLFFCYPTTTTASEGFAGYMRDPDFDAILMHSRARTDYRLLQNMPQPTHEDNDLRQAGLEALESWPVPAAVCTAHTVLGIMENVRRSLFTFPSLLQSVFVFDEIHAYSDRLFSYLLRFLKTFPGSNVLLMTATLPPSRKKVLEKISASRGGLDLIQGPREREHAKRYVLKKADEKHAWVQAEQTLQSGGKVLWICNTIKKAMRIIDQALEMKLPAQPFHSRYRYKDRLKRQQAVVQGFSAMRTPMLAVTTQVAEMSLDISADLLVSDHAPVASMIQRLGRLNRFEETPRQLKKAIFIEPEMILPYSKENWTGVDEWLAEVTDGLPKSQADLSRVFVKVAEEQRGEVSAAPFCEWIDGLWRTLKDQRAIEEAGYCVDVIREEDVDGDVVENTIPMPIPRLEGWQEWQRHYRYLIVPTGLLHYDDFRGAEWI